MSLTDFLGGASDPFLLNDYTKFLLPASHYANTSINPYEMFPYLKGHSEGILLSDVIPCDSKA